MKVIVKCSRESWFFFTYYLKIAMKNPIWVLVAMFQPVCYLFLYTPLLQGLYKKTGLPGVEAIKVFEPGLLVMLALFGTLFVGFALIDDLRSGIVERFRVTPIERASFLIGRAMRDIVVLEFQSCVILGLSYFFGVHYSITEIIFIFLTMGLLGLFISPLSYALGMTFKSEDTLGSLINFFVQPMILLSGILLPLNLGPEWIYHLSSVNPIRYIVSGVREMLAGNLFSEEVASCLIILLVLDLFSLWCGVRALKRTFN